MTSRDFSSYAEEDILLWVLRGCDSSVLGRHRVQDTALFIQSYWLDQAGPILA